jgi:hypothetical protein
VLRSATLTKQRTIFQGAEARLLSRQSRDGRSESRLGLQRLLRSKSDDFEVDGVAQGVCRGFDRRQTRQLCVDVDDDRDRARGVAGQGQDDFFTDHGFVVQKIELAMANTERATRDVRKYAQPFLAIVLGCQRDPVPAGQFHFENGCQTRSGEPDGHAMVRYDIQDQHLCQKALHPGGVELGPRRQLVALPERKPMLYEGTVDLFEINLGQDCLDGTLAEQDLGLAVSGYPIVNRAA